MIGADGFVLHNVANAFTDPPLQSWVTLVIAAVAAVGSAVQKSRANKKAKKAQQKADQEQRDLDAQLATKLNVARGGVSGPDSISAYKVTNKTATSSKSVNYAPIATVGAIAIFGALLLRKK